MPDIRFTVPGGTAGGYLAVPSGPGPWPGVVVVHEALGLTEEQAKALGIGVHRGRVYCAMRYGSGTVAGFLHVPGGKIILPKNLLPDVAPNVVRFPKRA